MNLFTWLLLQESQKICPVTMSQEELGDIVNAKIYFPDSILAKLSNVTNYDYLSDGYVSFFILSHYKKSVDSGEIIMKHWLQQYTKGCDQHEIIFYFACTQSLEISFHGTFVSIDVPDVDSMFHKPCIDIAWLTGHYMKPTHQLCDIVVICPQN